MKVSDSLRIELGLAIKSQRFNIPGGNIKNCRLNLFAYGFSGKLDFWISSDAVQDELFSTFVKPDLIEARLSIQGVHNLPSPEPDPLVLKCLVTDKSVREVTYKDVSGSPVLQRNYEITFADAPHVLWKQHFPTELYTDKKMADILKANAVEGISLEMDWDKLQQKEAMICLGLGNEQNEASFYDFLIWYVKNNHGVFEHNYQTQAVRISESKLTEKPGITFYPNEINDLRIHIPETCRHNVRILNASSLKPKKMDITQDQAVPGTSNDIILRTEIVKELDKRKSLESSKLFHREHEIEIGFNQFPLKTFRIGTCVHFDKGLWTDALYLSNKSYRVCEIQLKASAKEQEADHDRHADYAVYDMEMIARLEFVDNKDVPLPVFTPPHYPIYAEGYIISESGKDTDKTYQIYPQKKTSQDFYHVQVPLWNQKISVLFIPDMVTGHFYFPAYKNARVLLAIYHDYAEIDSFLDWGTGTRLSMDSQGNHILFGKNASSETSMRHVYKENKPVFSIQRVAGVDTELIRMEEKAIILQTKEETSREKTDESFDLTPKVSAAAAQLAMDKESATYEITDSFRSTKSEIKGKIDATVTETNARLETMDAEISGKVGEVKSEFKSAMKKISAASGKLKSTATSVKKELKENIRL